MGRLLLELGGPLPVERLPDLAVVEGLELAGAVGLVERPLGPAGVAGPGPVAGPRLVGVHSGGSEALAPGLGLEVLRV